MDFGARLAVAIVSLALEAAFGYPPALYTWIGHPVTWIGAAISAFDARLNRETMSVVTRKAFGALTLFAVSGAAAACAYILERWAAGSWLGMAACALVTASLLASGSLYGHVAAVAEAIERQGLDPARIEVARIVGRDTTALDEAGVARAAIESLAENASDGVVAPLFWFVCLGLPGLAAYKAINTADSMIGYRTPRHEAFGWAAARADDVVNLPASRLTGLLFAIAALLGGGNARGSMHAMLRDADRHRSPNAGWPESALAGALGLKLNGPKLYGGVPSNDAYMGDGRREATASDIRRALRLSVIGWSTMIGALALAAIIARF